MQPVAYSITTHLPIVKQITGINKTKDTYPIMLPIIPPHKTDITNPERFFANNYKEGGDYLRGGIFREAARFDLAAGDFVARREVL
jgi:hypothetical protein